MLDARTLQIKLVDSLGMFLRRVLSLKKNWVFSAKKGDPSYRMLSTKIKCTLLVICKGFKPHENIYSPVKQNIVDRRTGSMRRNGREIGQMDAYAVYVGFEIEKMLHGC